MNKRARLEPARIVAFLMCFAFLPLLVWARQELHPPTPHRHPEAQKLKNPIASDASSIEDGRKLYQHHCASCHGPSGKGAMVARNQGARKRTRELAWVK
jgi:cytochrome c